MRCFSAVAIVLLVPLLAAGQTKVKIIVSPDTMLTARITTVQESDGRNPESKVEFKRVRHNILGYQNFISRNHENGFGVLKAAWTFDSRFFVFSTMASGGREPGFFPTFVYSRGDNRIRLLDGLINTKITDPEFFIEAPDIVWIVGRQMSASDSSDTMVARSVHLSDLIK